MPKLDVVAYESSMGGYTLPEGARERLAGLTAADAAKCFYVLADGVPYALDACQDVNSLIMDGDIVVGVMLSDAYCHPTPCFVGERVCTWDSSDNNGAGYKCRLEYTSLHYGEKPKK
jgi:hypothetical protein